MISAMSLLARFLEYVGRKKGKGLEHHSFAATSEIEPLLLMRIMRILQEVALIVPPPVRRPDHTHRRRPQGGSCCIYPIYGPAHWKQPDTYARFSDIVEESGASAIIDGFSYFMDERDNEHRNNEEARGEGSRAQGILSTSGTMTQCQGERQGTGAQPVTISEDEFELIMGIFEKSPITRHRSSISYAFCCPSHVNGDRSPVNRA